MEAQSDIELLLEAIANEDDLGYVQRVKDYIRNTWDMKYRQ